MRTFMGIAAIGLALTLLGGTAGAQYYPPPYTIPPNAGYYTPAAPPVYYPTTPGGFVTGNPSPVFGGYYDPNRPVAGTGSASSYWDPYRGWVTNTQSTTVLGSALSPGRAPMPGMGIQNYNYWNGSQWVQGQRWLGMDGQWHGVNTGTQVTPGGSTSETTVYYKKP